MKFFKTLALVGVAQAFADTAGSGFDDHALVTSLPEIGDITGYDFKMYSGYMTVDQNKHLHYVLITSQGSMKDDPLQIWFNGGPGCSSMMGIFQEHGPWVVDDGQKTLHENPWSWNKKANILYVEMPAGVGYSHCTKDCSFDDDSTATENLAAITQWFNVYTYFQNHDLFVSGESYGGVYVPTFAQQLMMHNDAAKAGELKFNLKGFIVGNGVTDWSVDTLNAFANMGFWHGLYDKEMHDELTTLGCDFSGLLFNKPVKAGCLPWWEKFQQMTQGINTYDVYRKCYGFTPGMSMYDSDNFGMTKVGNEVKSYKKFYTAADYTPWVWEANQQSDVLKDLPPCVYGSYVVDYLNRYDVRSALHIPLDIQAWTYCTPIIKGQWEYTRLEKASLDVYKWFNTKHPEIDMLIYSGDTDGSVPTWGTLAWIESLKWKETTAWEVVKFDEEVEGYKFVNTQLTFRSIHGCGHMAPQWKRPETWRAIYDWQADVLSK